MLFIFEIHYRKVPLNTQIEIFIKQFDLAEKYKKLVNIHCVYEWEKLFKAIENHMNKDNLVSKSKIVLHSFQGTSKIADKFLKFNTWFSISPGCYNDKNFEMLRKLPIENMLLESDSPSMFNEVIYDDKSRYDFYYKEENGKFKNNPISIVDLSVKIAELKEISYEKFLNQMKFNSSKIINIIKSIK